MALKKKRTKNVSSNKVVVDENLLLTTYEADVGPEHLYVQNADTGSKNTPAIVGELVEVPLRSVNSPWRPHTSPYTQTPVPLSIGPDETIHWVPMHFLPSEWTKTGRKEHYHLSDVDIGTGHTLVHYLYTGTYEALESDDTASKSAAKVDLKRAILVYIMTRRYDLLELEQLATQEIAKISSQLDILEVLEVIDDNFAMLGPECWMRTYLYKRAREAFEKDHTVFLNELFLQGFQDTALNRFMTRCAMELYNERISHMFTTEEELTQRLNQPSKTTRDQYVETYMCKPEKNIEHSVDVPTVIADELSLERGCDHEVFEQDSATDEEFSTISCPHSATTDRSPVYEVETCSDKLISVDRYTALACTEKNSCDDSIKAVLEVPEVPELHAELALNEIISDLCEDGTTGSKGQWRFTKDGSVLESVQDTTIECDAPVPVVDMVVEDCTPEPALDESCTHRASHILEGNLWKTCRPCRAIVQRLIM